MRDDGKKSTQGAAKCQWCGDDGAIPGKWGVLCDRCFWDLVREKGRK